MTRHSRKMEKKTGPMYNGGGWGLGTKKTNKQTNKHWKEIDGETKKPTNRDG